jgi:hypothetical protein
MGIPNDQIGDLILTSHYNKMWFFSYKCNMCHKNFMHEIVMFISQVCHKPEPFV